MSNATGELTQISICKQDVLTQKVVPANPIFTVVPFDIAGGFAISANIKTEDSTEPEPDGGYGDPTVIGLDVAGTHSYAFRPFASGEDDELLAAGLYAEPWNALYSGSLKFSIAGAVYTAITKQIDFSLSAVVPDQIIDRQKIKISGSATTDGIYTLTYVSANVYELSPNPVFNETFGATATGCGEMIRNAQTEHILCYKKYHADKDLGEYFVGCKHNSMAVEFAIEAKVKITHTCQGQELVSLSEDSYAGETQVIPDTYKVFKTSDATGEVKIDGVGQITDCYVVAISLNATRTLTERKGLFVFGACGLDPSAAGLTGSLEVGFRDASLWDKLYDSTPMLLEINMPGSELVGYSFTIPRAILKSNSVPIQAGALTQKADFVAGYDQDYLSRIQLDRFDER